jgi:FMN phosphatase YigB (HAD superfamily)
MDFGLRPTKVVFVDLDNTLYDWLGFFGPAFRGLCTHLSELSGLHVDQLYDEFKGVFTEHGSVEYTFALQELPSLRRLHSNLSKTQLVAEYFDAILVYQSRRRRYLRAYSDVPNALRELRQMGIRIIAISDAHRFHVLNRLRQLDLLSLLDGVCCVEDHGGATDEDLSRIRRFEPSRYEIAAEYEFILPAGLRKPSHHVLDWLTWKIGLAPGDAIYVGDSLVKDIAMARRAGVYDCWAIYGTLYSPLDMATLVKVTNWSASLVNRVLNATPERLGIQPSCTIESFKEVVAIASSHPLPKVTERPDLVSSQLSLFELGAESVVSSEA